MHEITRLDEFKILTDKDIDLTQKQLTTLPQTSDHISGDFMCGGNKLSNLSGAPASVGRDFVCSYNQISSLSDAPSSAGNFDCSNNKITSLNGIKIDVDGIFDCSNNKITSLVGIEKQISCRTFTFDVNMITKGGIGLIYIESLAYISDRHPAFKIIKKYLRKGNKGFNQCRQELTQNGYEDYAAL